ncbi:hypothetical protein OIE49_06610 [Streptomyces sp. NBC_01788]|nr:hypothetical protein [Streptomyces sp. NBC_01788]WSB25572.1 hypothetical protein OIE49_06610 [Streptomyces sp. NBC_01788]
MLLQRWAVIAETRTATVGHSAPPEAVHDAHHVDLATRSGFEQFVELKQRPETGDAGGYSYTLPLKAKGLKAKQLADGSVLFTDKKNKKRAVMPAPVMWDATVDERSGEHTRKARVGLKVVQKGSSVAAPTGPVHTREVGSASPRRAPAAHQELEVPSGVRRCRPVRWQREVKETAMLAT